MCTSVHRPVVSRILQSTVGYRGNDNGKARSSRFVADSSAGCAKSNKFLIVSPKYITGIQEWTLDEVHPSRLASQHELAQAYESNGRAKDATELLHPIDCPGTEKLSIWATHYMLNPCQIRSLEQRFTAASL